MNFLFYFNGKMGNIYIYIFMYNKLRIKIEEVWWITWLTWHGRRGGGGEEGGREGIEASFFILLDESKCLSKKKKAAVKGNLFFSLGWSIELA